MSTRLNKLINDKLHQDYATSSGTKTHARMQRVFFNKDGTATGDADIIAKIANRADLVEYMGMLSKTEVPIAGYIGGKFISRRIDRLYVNDKNRTVVVIDYKTDLDKERFFNKYVEQLTEYRKLLSDIYTGYSITCKILWLNDFTLENII